MPPFVRAETRPRHRQARQPEPAQRVEHRRLIKRFLFRVTQRSDDHLIRAGGRMLPRQRRQRLSWTDLQEDSLLSPRQFSQAVGEAHRLAQMRRPVIRIGRLRRRDPLAGEVRHVGNLRGGQRRLPDLGHEHVQHRLHHFRMKRVRCLKPAAGRVSLVEFLFQHFDGIERSGGDAQRRPVDRRQ